MSLTPVLLLLATVMNPSKMLVNYWFAFELTVGPDWLLNMTTRDALDGTGYTHVLSCNNKPL